MKQLPLVTAPPLGIKESCEFELEKNCFINVQPNVLLSFIMNVDGTSPPHCCVLTIRLGIFPTQLELQNISKCTHSPLL